MPRPWAHVKSVSISSSLTPFSATVLILTFRPARCAASIPASTFVRSPHRATFSPDLADLTLYAYSVCQGEKIPRKGGPAITRSDLLIINKTDLAFHVGADLSTMQADTERARGVRPFVFTDLLRRIGVDKVVNSSSRPVVSRPANVLSFQTLLPPM